MMMVSAWCNSVDVWREGVECEGGVSVSDGEEVGVARNCNGGGVGTRSFGGGRTRS